MEAIVVGKKKVDFTDNNGTRVKKAIYYLNNEAENFEGYEVNKVSWDCIAKGKESPEYELNEVVSVEYNKYGRLVLV